MGNGTFVLGTSCPGRGMRELYLGFFWWWYLWFCGEELTLHQSCVWELQASVCEPFKLPLRVHLIVFFSVSLKQFEVVFYVLSINEIKVYFL